MWCKKRVKESKSNPKSKKNLKPQVHSNKLGPGFIFTKDIRSMSEFSLREPHIFAGIKALPMHKILVVPWFTMVLQNVANLPIQIICDFNRRRC